VNLPDFNPNLHPRGRAGRFVDAPDRPKLTSRIRQLEKDIAKDEADLDELEAEIAYEDEIAERPGAASFRARTDDGEGYYRMTERAKELQSELDDLYDELAVELKAAGQEPLGTELDVGAGYYVRRGGAGWEMRRRNSPQVFQKAYPTKGEAVSATRDWLRRLGKMPDPPKSVGTADPAIGQVTALSPFTVSYGDKDARKSAAIARGEKLDVLRANSAGWVVRAPGGEGVSFLPNRVKPAPTERSVPSAFYEQFPHPRRHRRR
jgi:hypothetical protein